MQIYDFVDMNSNNKNVRLSSYNSGTGVYVNSNKKRFQLFHAVALFCIYFSGIFFYICIFDSLIVLSLSLTQKLLNYYIF